MEMNKDVEEASLKQAERILLQYLKEHGLRKTPERFEMLKMIYQFHDPYDINTVKEAMKTSEFKQSLSTIYNTIILFEKASIIFRSKPNGRYSKFITNYQLEAKHYMICTRCGNVRMLPHSRLEKTISHIKWPRFKLETYTLFVQGICLGCQRKQEKENKN